LRTSVHAPGELLHHGVWRLTRIGKGACSLDDLVAIVIRQLREACSAPNAIRILRNESIDGTPQETNSLSSVDVKVTTRQAAVTPSQDGLRRHVEYPGEIVNGQNSLVDWHCKPGVEASQS
jgi:hypothetical protein